MKAYIVLDSGVLIAAILKADALRTHDFMIFCVGQEFNATIVTFDKAMHKKCRSVYRSIYFPAETKDMVDEAADVLSEIDMKVGEDVNADSYQALKTVPF